MLPATTRAEEFPPAAEFGQIQYSGGDRGGWTIRWLLPAYYEHERERNRAYDVRYKAHCEISDYASMSFWVLCPFGFGLADLRAIIHSRLLPDLELTDRETQNDLVMLDYKNGGQSASASTECNSLAGILSAFEAELCLAEWGDNPKKRAACGKNVVGAELSQEDIINLVRSYAVLTAMHIKLLPYLVGGEGGSTLPEKPTVPSISGAFAKLDTEVYTIRGGTYTCSQENGIVTLVFQYGKDE